MKMKTVLLAPILVMGFSVAHASDQFLDLSELTQAADLHESIGIIFAAEETPQSCIDANVTEAQNLEIKKSVENSKKEMVVLKQRFKQATNEFETTVKDVNSTRSSAQTVSAKVTNSLAMIARSKLNLVNDILYRILQTEQRNSGYECLKAVVKSEMKKELKKVCDRMNPPAGPDQL